LVLELNDVSREYIVNATSSNEISTEVDSISLRTKSKYGFKRKIVVK